MKILVQQSTGILLRLRVFLILLLPVSAFAQPANNLCGGAIALTQTSPSCSNLAGTLVAATYTAVTGACGAGAPAGNRNDVWYTFVAKSQNPTITISGNLASNQPSLQLFSGTCASLTSVQCAVSSTTLVAAGLTVGNTYYVRVWSNNNTASTFNICISDPAPANDLCGAAITLTSATSCSPTTGNMYASTITATTITAPDCSGGSATYDVWYKFVAQTTNPTITLSNIGSSFSGVAGLQLLSNNCGGTFISYYCGTTSIAADFLTPGTTYFIRVYGTGAVPSTSANNGFDICVTDPVSPAPFNDDCANAVNLPIWNTCNNIAGNMAGATASGIALGGSCTGPLAYDVWYKFTSINTSATITLSSIGTNFLNPRIEILSGSCGSLTSVACGTSPLTAATLTAGSVYYVRIYSTTSPAPNGNARFNICATTTNAPVRFGNSYVNITRKTTGGVVQTGDTLEIRMTINHTSGTMYNLRYVDSVPTKTVMATGAADRIRIITNEGLAYKNYTLAAGDDAATYKVSPPAGEYQIRMNLGFGGTNPGIPANNTSTEFASATGTMTNTNKPVGGGGLLFAVAYRVVVTGVAGDTINLKPGKFLYKTAAGSGPDVILTATPFKILISDPLTLCANSIGVNSAAEYGGTFGSGTTLNRSSDLSNPIGGYSFISDVSAYTNVGDGRYALVKNLSPRTSSNRTARRMNSCNSPSAISTTDVNSCTNRMFNGFWYIDGDHSGTSNATGNTPPGSGVNGGYMLMVNADYVASEIYRQTITNLCPNTYYEFSAWVRNICPVCGIDSTGAQFTGTPTAPASGYPGVYPNLSFSLNDVDYYSTGEVDTLGWLKRGFVFKTGSSQTSATFTIRNNSQGGGGNDWALDDIAVATCFPNMTYSPTYNPNVCENNPITISDTIRSYFDNYTLYKWQRSTDGGATWTDIPGASGTATPVWNGSAYEYIVNYTIPASQTGAGNAGDMYRVVVASTGSNLGSSDCSYTDPTAITLNVLLNCGPPLSTDFLSVSGRLVQDKARISWETPREEGLVRYRVDRSDDGTHFSEVTSVNGHNNINAETNYYSFDDPNPVAGKAYYRVALLKGLAVKTYSRTLRLSLDLVNTWKLSSVTNPFYNDLQYEITSPAAALAKVELIDNYGRVYSSFNQRINPGVNALVIGNTGNLARGLYLLRVSINGSFVLHKVVKG